MKISKVHQDAKDALALVQGLSNQFPADDALFDAVTTLRTFIEGCVAHEAAEVAMEPVGHDVYKEQTEESA